MKNESCLRWDLNPRHTVLQTHALPTELPRQPSWQGPNHVRIMSYIHVHNIIHVHVVYNYVHV